MECPGGPEVRTLHPHCPGYDSLPDGETRIPRTMWLSQKEKNRYLVKMPQRQVNIITSKESVGWELHRYREMGLEQKTCIQGPRCVVRSQYFFSLGYWEVISKPLEYSG